MTKEANHVIKMDLHNIIGTIQQEWKMEKDYIIMRDLKKENSWGI